MKLLKCTEMSSFNFNSIDVPIKPQAAMFRGGHLLLSGLKALRSCAARAAAVRGACDAPDMRMALRAHVWRTQLRV